MNARNWKYVCRATNRQRFHIEVWYCVDGKPQAEVGRFERPTFAQDFAQMMTDLKIDEDSVLEKEACFSRTA